MQKDELLEAAAKVPVACSIAHHPPDPGIHQWPILKKSTSCTGIRHKQMLHRRFSQACIG